MHLFDSLPDSQLALAILILLATFIYEDGATLLAATLSASGRLNPWFGLATTFMGIWIGDLGLYALGYSMGRRLALSRRFTKYVSAGSLRRAETWFERHGTFALVMSRVIPGSRLPLYIAAGALRLSAGLFARTTAICSALWVAAIFAIWRFMPKVAQGGANRTSFVVAVAVLSSPWMLAKGVRLIRTTREQKVRHPKVDLCAL